MSFCFLLFGNFGIFLGFISLHSYKVYTLPSAVLFLGEDYTSLAVRLWLSLCCCRATPALTPPKCVQIHRRVPSSSSGLASWTINLQTHSVHFSPSSLLSLSLSPIIFISPSLFRPYPSASSSIGELRSRARAWPLWPLTFKHNQCTSHLNIESCPSRASGLIQKSAQRRPGTIGSLPMLARSAGATRSKSKTLSCSVTRKRCTGRVAASSAADAACGAA